MFQTQGLWNLHFCALSLLPVSMQDHHPHRPSWKNSQLQQVHQQWDARCPTSCAGQTANPCCLPWPGCSLTEVVGGFGMMSTIFGGGKG